MVTVLILLRVHLVQGCGEESATSIVPQCVGKWDRLILPASGAVAISVQSTSPRTRNRICFKKAGILCQACEFFGVLCSPLPLRRPDIGRRLCSCWLGMYQPRVLFNFQNEHLL